MQQRKWAMLAAGAMLSTLLTGCMEKHGELGNRNIRGNSISYDMNGNRILNTRFANDQMNEMNRADGHRLNSNNLVGLHKNYRLEMSEAMSDRISNLKGVGKAYVMLTDDNAYVAVSFKNGGTKSGANAMSYSSPMSLSRTQQAYMRPYNMQSYNAHTFTKTHKGTRASSIATPNMHLRSMSSRASSIATPNMRLRSSSTGAGIIRAKSARPMHAKTMQAKHYGYQSSSFHNVSNGVRNMSLMNNTVFTKAKNLNGMTINHPNGMTNLSKNTARGLTNLTRDMSRGTANTTNNMNRTTSNVGRDLYRGTSNAGTDLYRGTANVGRDIYRGTSNVANDLSRGSANTVPDMARGTANVGRDILRGTANVGTDVARGTVNVGRDIVRGTGNVGTDVARGTANVGRDITRGTANTGMDVARGTANAGRDITRGTANVGTDVARGTVDLGRDVARGVRDMARGTADLLRGTTGMTRDMARDTTDFTRDATRSNLPRGTTGMTNLSRNTTDLSRTVSPYAVSRGAAGSDVNAALEKQIADVIKQMSPQIKHVYVSANPDFVSRMGAYMADVKSGHTIQGYIAEFNALVERIFPARITR